MGKPQQIISANQPELTTKILSFAREYYLILKEKSPSGFLDVLIELVPVRVPDWNVFVTDPDPVMFNACYCRKGYNK
jgi:hypothetical protein